MAKKATDKTTPTPELPLNPADKSAVTPPPADAPPLQATDGLASGVAPELGLTGENPEGGPAEPVEIPAGYDPANLKKGDSVHYWLPLSGAGDQLLLAKVEKVHRGHKDEPRLLDLSYTTVAGVQLREEVAYVGPNATPHTRINRWDVMPTPVLEDPTE